MSFIKHEPKLFELDDLGAIENYHGNTEPSMFKNSQAQPPKNPSVSFYYKNTGGLFSPQNK